MNTSSSGKADDVTIGEMVERIAQKLVNHPDDVKVSMVDGDYTAVIELRVNKEDVGQIIGKKGCIAQSIRTLLMAMSGKEGRRYILEILD